MPFDKTLLAHRVVVNGMPHFPHSDCWEQTDASESAPDRVKEGRKQAMAHVHGCCKADFLHLVEFDSLGEHIALLLLDLTKDLVIECNHCSRGVACSARKEWQELAGFLKVGSGPSSIISAIGFPLLVEHHLLAKFWFSDSICFKFIQWKIDTVSLDVFTYVPEYVG